MWWAGKSRFPETLISDGYGLMTRAPDTVTEVICPTEWELESLTIFFWVFLHCSTVYLFLLANT